MQIKTLGRLFGAGLALTGFPGAAAAGGGTDWDTIDTVMTSEVTYFRIIMTSTTDNPDSCTGGGVYYFIDDTHSQYDLIVSMLLSAKLAGNDVKFYLDGCRDVSGMTYPKIRTVHIQ